MSKAFPVKAVKDQIIGYMIFCPACQCGHLFYTNHANAKRNWTFNGDLESPTFSPSMLIHRSSFGSQKRCHSFVRDGKIQFLSDCEHDLKSQIVKLPNIDNDAEETPKTEVGT